MWMRNVSESKNPLINHTFSTGEAFTLQKIHSQKNRFTHRTVKKRCWKIIGWIEVDRVKKKEQKLWQFVEAILCVHWYESFN